VTGQDDITTIITVLASTGVLTALVTGVRGVARHFSGRERREQTSIRALKSERDLEWRRRIKLGDAYAVARRLAAEAGADPADLVALDRMVDGIEEEDNGQTRGNGSNEN